MLPDLEILKFVVAHTHAVETLLDVTCRWVLDKFLFPIWRGWNVKAWLLKEVFYSDQPLELFPPVEQKREDVISGRARLLDGKWNCSVGSRQPSLRGPSSNFIADRRDY